MSVPWLLFAQMDAPEVPAPPETPPAAAANWQEQLQAINDKVPEYVGKLGLPVFETMPLMDVVTDFAVILAAIALLVAVWRLLTLRIFRSFFAVVATVLILYYPVAYGVHWWLFEYQKDAKAERAEEDIPKWETQMKDNLRWVDYGILGAGVFLGGTLLLLSRPRRERDYDYEDAEQAPAEESKRAPWHQPPPEKPSRRSRGGGQQKDPFDFS